MELRKITESKGWRWCRRYIRIPLMVVMVYLVFVVYFNDNSYRRSNELQEEIDRLQAEIRDNNDTTLFYRQLNESLSTDPATLERIVREKYHMKRPGEDVYVVEG